LDEKYPIRSEITGTIVNITDFGIFVEVKEGVEGLVHISEVDSAIPKAKIPEFYPVNTEVHARVIKVDLEERRLGLSILRVVGVESPLENSKQDAEAAPEAAEAPAETETAPALAAEGAPEVEATEGAPEAKEEKPKKKRAAPKKTTTKAKQTTTKAKKTTTKAKKADDEQPAASEE
ncbi:MAG: S1 RNA-binding domain-containing protein, partial [SAR324 cluster bacterium]|nr:S1 RNA-binding domain-containing protein [SAR324 cluster bacterium]